MSDLPVFTVADLEAQPALDVATFTNDDAVDLGLIAVALIRERGLSLAVRIVLHDDVVFQAKLGDTGPGNDEWLGGQGARRAPVRRAVAARAASARGGRDAVRGARRRRPRDLQGARRLDADPWSAASSSARSRRRASRMWSITM